ncbi:hypothetical protein [Actinopolymorpha alba]|uniref:hypothetical protein n=1 Tax=Actinopolymorpha alba TaxID=533267 RepID=UPI00036DDF5B|nr:hypothetical protein [Actinopolymorpha alba]
MSDETSFRTEVLLSLQRALWGMITPDIRAISVGWKDGIIRVRFIYDHQVTENDLEIVSEVEGEVLADFEPHVAADFSAEFSSEEMASLRNDGWWAYVRREL